MITSKRTFKKRNKWLHIQIVDRGSHYGVQHYMNTPQNVNAKLNLNREISEERSYDKGNTVTQIIQAIKKAYKF